MSYRLSAIGFALVIGLTVLVKNAVLHAQFDVSTTAFVAVSILELSLFIGVAILFRLRFRALLLPFIDHHRSFRKKGVMDLRFNQIMTNDDPLLNQMRDAIDDSEKYAQELVNDIAASAGRLVPISMELFSTYETVSKTIEELAVVDNMMRLNETARCNTDSREVSTEDLQKLGAHLRATLNKMAVDSCERDESARPRC